jgi:hypothetical protein
MGSMKKQSQYLEWEYKFRNEAHPGMPFSLLDPDLDEALRSLDINEGNVLELGTGLGCQAIALTKRGFRVTATDISDTAIRRASEKAKKKGFNIKFIQDNILKSQLDGQFDFIFDRGCFAVLPVPGQRLYVRIVREKIRPGGYLFLKCDASPDYIPGTIYFTPEKITGLFEPDFKVLSIKNSIYQMDLKGQTPYKALFCILHNLQ